MRIFSHVLIAAALSTLPSAFAQAEMQAEPTEENVLVCATSADAMSYAASHKDALQSSIAGGPTIKPVSRPQSSLFAASKAIALNTAMQPMPLLRFWLLE